MRVPYCCNAKAYEQYYLNQVGHGVFRGAQYQQGYGLGNIFSAISKTILPLVKSGAKAVGKEALRSGVGFASNVLAGKNAKQAAVDRAKAAGNSLLRRATKRKRPYPVQKKRRKKNSDIFA